MPYLLYVVAALVVAGVGATLRRRSALLGGGLIALGLAGCAVALVCQFRQTLWPASERVASRAHWVVGFALAGPIQRAVAGQHGAVVVMMPPASALGGESVETCANALRGPLLRGHPELEFKVVTLEASAKEAKAGTIPLAAFKRALAQAPGALAYISYTGVPADFGSLFPENGAAAPPVFVVDAYGTTNWVKPLAEHRICSVVVPRPGASGGAGRVDEAFDSLYYYAIPENAEQIAAKLAAAPAPKPR